MTRTKTITVRTTPAGVQMSRPDGDETIPGHRVTIRGAYHLDGTVTPPEGESMDCWCSVPVWTLPGDTSDIVKALMRAEPGALCFNLDELDVWTEA